MSVDILLRKAFGVPDDFSVPEVEIKRLSTAFAGIKPYFILFTARSGSTFLTHEIRATRVLSEPHEWFNWDNVSGQSHSQTDPVSDYIRKLVDDKKSPNGVFGMEVNWLQWVAINSIVPMQKVFPQKVRWFFLRRRNVVAQAISNYLADHSKVFHSYQIDDAARGKVLSVPYDGEKIRKYITGFITQEQRCMEWLENSNTVPVNLYYEDIVANPRTTMLLFSNVMGVWLPKDYLEGTPANPITRVGGALNTSFEDRFRCEEADFLGRALLARPPVLVDASREPGCNAVPA